MQLALGSDEAEVLEEILSSALGDLREQVYKAEVAEYNGIDYWLQGIECCDELGGK